MNLKENIKRILNESTFFRRRVDMSLMDKEFFEVLNYVANKLITKHDEGKIVKFTEFKNRVIDYLIDNYHGELSDWGKEEYPYVEVYEFLSNHFKDKIKEKYDLMFNRNINESKTLQENEEDPTQKILNFLLRRYEIEEVDLGWGDNPIKLKMIKFDVDQGERYSISTFENKRQQIAKILDMLTTHNVIDDIDSNEGKLDPYTQKVVRAVKQFINQAMGNKSNMNESENKEGKYISALEDLTEDFKNEDCVCDIKIEYKPEEEIYLINVILGNLDMDDKFNGVNWRERDYRGKLKTKIRKEVFGYLPIPFFVEFKQTPRCKDYKNLQESEDDKEKKIQKNLIVLEKLISMFDYSEVCDMWIDYHYEDDDYIIRSKMSTKNHNTAALEKEFEFLENSIESLGFTNCYVFRPYYVENCEDEIKFLNESEDKKSRFLSTIEEDGLFQVMQDTGLSLPQIYTKTGELPREVLERYVKDFIKNDGYTMYAGGSDIGLELSIEVSPNIEVGSFYLSKGVVTIEVNEFDSRGRTVAGSIERLSVLSDEEIFTIVDELSQLNDDYLDYM